MKKTYVMLIIFLLLSMVPAAEPIDVLPVRKQAHFHRRYQIRSFGKMRPSYLVRTTNRRTGRTHPW